MQSKTHFHFFHNATQNNPPIHFRLFHREITSPNFHSIFYQLWEETREEETRKWRKSDCDQDPQVKGNPDFSALKEQCYILTQSRGYDCGHMNLKTRFCVSGVRQGRQNIYRPFTLITHQPERSVSGDEPIFQDQDPALNDSVSELNSVCLR